MNPLARTQLETLYDHASLEALFDSVSDIWFYIKDRQSRLITCNDALLRIYNLKDKSELAYFDEALFFPTQVAEPIHRDDQHVLETGETITDRIELLNDAKGNLSWVRTNKVAIFDHENNIIGLMGITRRSHDNSQVPHSFTRFNSTLTFIKEHFRRPISVKELAEMNCLSESQFRRAFKQIFNVSPQNFILRYRVQAASQALSGSNKTIVEIAEACGFCDQSYFTRQFKTLVGMSPMRYRSQYVKLKKQQSHEN